jgi:hypothetical protein
VTVGEGEGDLDFYPKICNTLADCLPQKSTSPLNRTAESWNKGNLRHDESFLSTHDIYYLYFQPYQINDSVEMTKL